MSVTMLLSTRNLSSAGSFFMIAPETVTKSRHTMAHQSQTACHRGRPGIVPATPARYSTTNTWSGGACLEDGIGIGVSVIHDDDRPTLGTSSCKTDNNRFSQSGWRLPLEEFLLIRARPWKYFLEINAWRHMCSPLNVSVWMHSCDGLVMA